MGRLSVVVLAVLIGTVLCCQPPDCDTPDCGSCAQACCLIEFMLDAKPDDVYKMVVDSLKKGGADGRYKFVNGTDYRSDNISVQYQLQAIHSTLVHHYNDTLDMLIMTSKNPGMTVLKGFSISEIEGAYCDDGQNYKNLVGFVKGIVKEPKMKVIFGCTKNP